VNFNFIVVCRSGNKVYKSMCRIYLCRLDNFEKVEKIDQFQESEKKSVIPMLIKEFQNIFELTIMEEQDKKINLREYRFNLTQFLLDLHEELE